MTKHINPPSFNKVLEFLAFELGIGTDENQLSPESLDRLKTAYDQSVESKNRKTNGGFNPISVAGIQVLNQMAGIGWTTTSHTGSHVPVYAIGSGQQLFSGQMDNTDIPKRIAKVMGLSF